MRFAMLVLAMSGCCGGGLPASEIDPAVQQCNDVFGASDPGPVGIWRGCLYHRPRDLAQSDFVVEDVRQLAGRGDVVTELTRCEETPDAPTCWELVDDADCQPTALRFQVQRPLTGPPPDTFTRFSYACLP